MRIIGGKFKGKSINYLKSLTTRPLRDYVKENIFNILKHSKEINLKIENAEVLDLYSGVGSFGLECISRGAKCVTFVENDKKALEILVSNLKKISAKNKSNLISDKIENVLKTNKFHVKFDIFFLDPPFASNSYINFL